MLDHEFKAPQPWHGQIGLGTINIILIIFLKSSKHNSIFQRKNIQIWLIYMFIFK